jgi:tetratricopeptide (TPR) repeat protein
LITRRALGAAALGALAGGCATAPPQTAALRTSGAPQAPPVELTAVPFFPQTRYHCGPAALATVLVHLGRAVTPEQLADAVFLPAREGSLQAEMLAGTRRHGALAVRLPGRIDALMQEVSAGRPVVVLQNLGLAIYPRWHYAVLIGHDLARDQLILRSGTERRHVIGYTPFEHTWARSGHWAFAAVRPGELPLTAIEEDAVQAALGFERVAPPAQALRAWEAVLARWPENLVAAIGVGNTRHAAGDLRGAAAAFEAAARRHRDAAAWINLGEVALQLGERDRARAAAREALAIGGVFSAQAQALADRAAAAR